MSAREVFLFSVGQIEEGSPVEIVMTLPHEIALDGRNDVRWQGYVQRIKLIGLNRVGMAAQIESFEFLDGNLRKRALE